MSIINILTQDKSTMNDLESRYLRYCLIFVYKGIYPRSNHLEFGFIIGL